MHYSVTMNGHSRNWSQHRVDSRLKLLIKVYNRPERANMNLIERVMEFVKVHVYRFQLRQAFGSDANVYQFYMSLNQCSHLQQDQRLYRLYYDAVAVYRWRNRPPVQIYQHPSANVGVMPGANAGHVKKKQKGHQHARDINVRVPQQQMGISAAPVFPGRVDQYQAPVIAPQNMIRQPSLVPGMQQGIMPGQGGLGRPVNVGVQSSAVPNPVGVSQIPIPTVTPQSSPSSVRAGAVANVATAQKVQQITRVVPGKDSETGHRVGINANPARAAGKPTSPSVPSVPTVVSVKPKKRDVRPTKSTVILPSADGRANMTVDVNKRGNQTGHRPGMAARIP